jgi:hypothetical protein
MNSAYSRNVYEEQGEQFQLVKTSPHNRQKLREYMDGRTRRMTEREEALEQRAMGEEVELPEAVDQYEMSWDWFVMLTEGPHEEIDREHFDEKLGEQVLSDFVPQATRTLLVQQGLLPPLAAL